MKKAIKEYLNGFSDGQCIYGIKALQQFADDLPHFIDLYGESFSENMFKLNYGLKIYGLVSSKFLLYKVFKGLVQNKVHMIESTIPNTLEEIVKEWSKISLLIVRAGVLKSSACLLSISNRVKAVTLKEENILKKVFSIL